MKHLGQETQVTAPQQAIHINYTASIALTKMYSNIGPHSSYKMLIPPTALYLTRDGSSLCKNITFTHPYSIIVTKAAQSLSNMLGDGTKSFICIVDEIFKSSYNYLPLGAHNIITGLQNATDEIMKHLKTLAKDLTDEYVEKMAYFYFITRVEEDLARKLASHVIQALKHISLEDILMVEVIRMEEGDAMDTIFVDGLVLDHGNRHPMMPTDLKDVVLLTGSISLEYEKPEINAQFIYKTSEQRDSLLASEHKQVFDRATAIANFAKAVKEHTGKNLVFINEKGIDPVALEILSNASCLALRRAKKRNMERIIKMCGGSFVSRIEQLDVSILGYCEKVRVISMGDDKYTFLEGTPFKGSCTILVKGSRYEKTEEYVKSGLKYIAASKKNGKYIEGGVTLYDKLISFLDSKVSFEKENINENNEFDSENKIIGYRIMKEAFYSMTRFLSTDKDARSIFFNKLKKDEKVIDSYAVVRDVIYNAYMLGTNLLLVDDIIKAGKPIKEEGKGEQGNN